MDPNAKTENNSNQHFYRDYKEDMILRDILAADRTILANERTILSYIRTALNFAIAGISLVNIFSGLFVYISGGALMFSSILFLIIGITRYIKTKKDINHVRK